MASATATEITLPTDAEINNIIKKYCSDPNKSPPICADYLIKNNITLKNVKTVLNYVKDNISILTCEINIDPPIKNTWIKGKTYLPIFSYASGHGIFEYIVMENIKIMYPDYGIIGIFAESDPEADSNISFNKSIVDINIIIRGYNIIFNTPIINIKKFGRDYLNDTQKKVYNTVIYIFNNTKLCITVHPQYIQSNEEELYEIVHGKRERVKYFNYIDKTDYSTDKPPNLFSRASKYYDFLNTLGFILRNIPNEAKFFVFWTYHPNNTLFYDDQKIHYNINNMGDFKNLLKVEVEKLTLYTPSIEKAKEKLIKITSNISGNIIITEKP
jgi:hypothetical protein